MINQNNDAAISDSDLDKVAGGFFASFFGAIFEMVKATSGGQTGGSRPADQFQQTMQQMKQGSG
jgi:hypothetical protein